MLKMSQSEYESNPEEGPSTSKASTPKRLPNGKPKDELEWPAEDFRELFRRIEASLPENDTLQFSTRTKKTDWNDVAFKSYDGDECKNVWLQVCKKMRHYRTTRELLADARDWVTNPVKVGQKNKIAKHPDMPKAPPSVYIYYYMKKRDKVVQENPGLTNQKDIAKVIGEMYRNISPAKKQKLERQFALEKEKYKEKLEEFHRTHPEYALEIERLKLEKTNVKKNVGPKKPRTPLEIYVNERGKDPEAKLALREKWKTLSDKKKAKWIKWAVAEEEVYKNEFKTYLEENPGSRARPQRSLITKEERQILERTSGRPVKPVQSAYQLFTKTMLDSDEMKDIPPRQRMNIVGTQWKACSEEEKDQYKQRLAHMNEQYEQDLQAYLETLPEDERQLEMQGNTSQKRKSSSPLKAPKKKKKKVEEDERESEPHPESDEEPEPRTMAEIFEAEPIQPASSAFELFANEHGWDMEEAEEEWENLGKKQKKKYEKMLVNLRQAYMEEYEKFLNSLSKEQLFKYSSLKGQKKKQKTFSESSDN